MFGEELTDDSWHANSVCDDGAVALVVLAGLLTPPVVAQIRATFVRDVDGVARGVRYIENQSFTYPTGAFSVISGVGGIGYVPQAFQATSATSGQRHFTGDADLDVVINQGESVLVFVFRNNNLGSQSLNFTRLVLTGHLIVHVVAVAEGSA